MKFHHPPPQLRLLDFMGTIFHFRLFSFHLSVSIFIRFILFAFFYSIFEIIFYADNFFFFPNISVYFFSGPVSVPVVGGA